MHDDVSTKVSEYARARDNYLRLGDNARDSADKILEREMVIGETLARGLRNTLGVSRVEMFTGSVVKYCEQRRKESESPRARARAESHRSCRSSGSKPPLPWFRQYWFSDFAESELSRGQTNLPLASRPRILFF